MKIKKEYSVLVLIILVLFTYLILRGTDRTHFELPGITPPSSGDISRLVFSSGKGSVTLERRDGLWRILPEEYIADRSLVEKMSAVVSGFSITTLASESGSYAVYDLEGDKKIKLDVYCGEEKALSFEIGKKASTNRHTFVRLDGKKGVYQVTGDFRSAFDLGLDRLRDKSVFNAEKDQITAIRIIGAEGPIEVIKSTDPRYAGVDARDAEEIDSGKSVWQTADGTPLEEGAVSRIVSSLSNIRCEGYIDGMTKGDLKDPVFSMIVYAGAADTLSIFETDEERYPAVSSQNEYPFFLPKWKAEQIIKGACGLLPADSEDPGVD
ncbi:MAG: DUF4340 domain-containing protein [Candidatus Krumholzibacteriota bacterium]|nr:DUF4340 domain-containing protein [Candidatus Krumholzibacteriota bacterium]